MADEELLGLDGTQSLPTPPLLPDPLGGLVTGSVFTDPVAILGPAMVVPPPPVTPYQEQVRRTTSAPRRTTARTPGASTPDAIPVAAALRSRQVQRPVTRPAQQPGMIAPTRGGTRQSRQTQPRQTPQTPQLPRSTATRRSGGAGCSVFLVIFFLLVVFFIVLGIVSGHGASGGGLQGG